MQGFPADIPPAVNVAKHHEASRPPRPSAVEDATRHTVHRHTARRVTGPFDLQTPVLPVSCRQVPRQERVLPVRAVARTDTLATSCAPSRLESRPDVVSAYAVREVRRHLVEQPPEAVGASEVSRGPAVPYTGRDTSP